MNTYLNWLARSIGDKLSAETIGRPVFVRAHLQLTADHGLLEPLLAAALDVSASWMGGPIHRLYVQGGAAAGFLSALAEFAAGQTALVSAELVHGGQPSLQVLVAGQRGVARLDDLPEISQLGGQLAAPAPPVAGAIRKSLAAAAPVVLE